MRDGPPSRTLFSFRFRKTEDCLDRSHPDCGAPLSLGTRMTSFVSSRSCAILLNIRLKWPYLVRRSKIPWKSFRLTPSTPTVSDLKARWASSKTPKSPMKSRATVRLDDLPQGVLASPSVNHDAAQDAFQYPTVIQQARNNMRNYDDCVVLTRVGNFYEV